MQQNSDVQYPAYFGILSDADKIGYTNLRVSMSNTTSVRNKRTENFSETLEVLRRFCCRGDKDDWKRCLVSGICWLQEGIAINIRQLKILISRCKSSINGSFHKIGLTATLGHSETIASISAAFPLISNNLNELRQWTIRQACTTCPSPASPPSTQNSFSPKNFEIPILNVYQPVQAAAPKPLPIPCINFTQAKLGENSYNSQSFDEPVSEILYEPSGMDYIEEPFAYNPW